MTAAAFAGVLDCCAAPSVARGAFEMLVRRFSHSSVLADIELIEYRKMLATVHRLAQPKASRSRFPFPPKLLISGKF